MATTSESQALPPAAPSASLISTTLLICAILGVAAVFGLVSSGFPLIAPFFGFLGIAALVIAYARRGEAAGTWLASHYRWLIPTYWYSLLCAVVGMPVVVLLGARPRRVAIASGSAPNR